MEVTKDMNDEERNQGYLLGRMFACIERMQELALGDVGAGVTDKYFSAACATPQAVFPRLLKTEVHHFRKAREGKWGGSAVFTHRMIDQLATWLVGEKNGMQDREPLEDFLKRTAGRAMTGFPPFLPLPEQGLFTLGYHQQRAEFFKKREPVTAATESESE
jgi:CRISPR-associated protein Csd1